MNINLLAEGLLLVLSILLTALLSFLVLHLTKKVQRHGLIYASLITAAVTLILEYVLHLFYPSDKLPWTLWLMFFPFVFGLFIQPLFWRGNKKARQYKWLALGSVPLSLLFTLVLVNNYYRFYPTLYSVLNIETREQALAVQKSTYIQFGNTSQKKFDSSTIEASLYGSPGGTKGTILPIRVPGEKSKFKARDGYLYSPPAANSPAKINLPVLVLLPGTPGLTRNTLDGFDVYNTMNSFAFLHHGIAPYVFMLDDSGSIDNDTECVDSGRGNAETYLSVDVPAYIKSHYEVALNPSNWAIGGLSMGGMCAAMLTLRHPNVYHYFLDFGGENGPEVGSKSKTIAALFNGSEKAWEQHQIDHILSDNNFRDKAIGGYFVTARNDSQNLVQSLSSNYTEAKDAGLESVYESINGDHTFNVWQQAFKDSLPWISSRLGATICPLSCK